MDDIRKRSAFSTLPGALCVLAVLIGVATGWLGSCQGNATQRVVLPDLTLKALPPEPEPPGIGNPASEPLTVEAVAYRLPPGHDRNPDNRPRSSHVP